MKTESGQHLTYCLNIHPGESWAENLQAIQTHALRVRDRVCPDNAFGLGLRLGARAAQELQQGDRLAEFRELLASQNLYVFTINGFPYGPFHGTRVKEQVYQPDWTTVERCAYTVQLAEILGALLPPDMTGSISTVPGTYAPCVQGEASCRRMTEQLMVAVSHLAKLHRETGQEIHLGLEPEPDCFIETTDQFLSFYTEWLLGRGRDELAAISGESRDTAETWIRRHLGVCVDTCHAALQFEAPETCLDRYRETGVRVSKIQLSAALETANTASACEALRAFNEPVYLHQVRARRTNGEIVGWPDLPEALAELPRYSDVDTVRVHFHVPLFWTGTPPLNTTVTGLSETFWANVRSGTSPHLEIETYTFSVLPASLKSLAIEQSITREFEWVENSTMAEK